ncbi:MAG: hypothetical protein OSJ46_11575 [Duncaniella sp.]|nr:hypothetical protein [Duncaniella sp.]
MPRNENMDIKWHVLNYIAPTPAHRDKPECIVEQFNRSDETGCLELFAPTFVEMTQRDGKWKRKETPLLFHYVFVRGTEGDVKDLCSRPNGFSLIINHTGTTRYATVSDSDMEAFKTIARFYGNMTIPCFSTEEIDLEEGDRVEVAVGPFAGLTGAYISRKGSRNGNILISVTGALAAVVYDIKAEYVKVLQFAKDTKRAYDQIESFIPRLFAALRDWDNGKVTTQSITPLVIFNRRMESVTLRNDKLDAKLQILLMTSAIILGDTQSKEKAAERFKKLSHTITNPVTAALAILLQAIVSRDRQQLIKGYDLLTETEKLKSAFHATLLAEYRHYIDTSDKWVKP